MVPLANMFGYINNLRSMSQGRAQYSMFFDHYEKVPQNVQDEVTKKIAEKWINKILEYILELMIIKF
jgi:elongation factor G